MVVCLDVWFASDDYDFGDLGWVSMLWSDLLICCVCVFLAGFVGGLRGYAGVRFACGFGLICWFGWLWVMTVVLLRFDLICGGWCVAGWCGVDV